MNTYAPTNYRCPFCVLTGVDDENAYSGKTDIVYHNDEVTAFISPHQCPGSPGTTIVIPNMHVGNMHDLSIYLVMRMHELTQTYVDYFEFLRTLPRHKSYSPKGHHHCCKS